MTSKTSLEPTPAELLIELGVQAVSSQSEVSCLEREREGSLAKTSNYFEAANIPHM